MEFFRKGKGCSLCNMIRNLHIIEKFYVNVLNETLRKRMGPGKFHKKARQYTRRHWQAEFGKTKKSVGFGPSTRSEVEEED